MKHKQYVDSKQMKHQHIVDMNNLENNTMWTGMKHDTDAWCSKIIRTYISSGRESFEKPTHVGFVKYEQPTPAGEDQYETPTPGVQKTWKNLHQVDRKDLRNEHKVDRKNTTNDNQVDRNNNNINIKLKVRHMKNQHQTDRKNMKHLHHARGERPIHGG